MTSSTMDAIPARVLALGRSYATNDPVIHSVKYIAFPAANPLSSPPAPSGIDYPASVGWHLTPDEAYALHLNEFGYLNIFRLKEGPGNTFPEFDVGPLACQIQWFYGIPNAALPATFRALLRSGIAVKFIEPCYAWIAPPDYASLGDQTVLDGLLAAGRLRPLIASDASTMLAQWKYTMKTSHAALVKDVERFPSLGIVGEGGVGLDGWVVTRDDGSISVLHVMDSCRRKGYAQALTQGLCREHAKTPLSVGPRTPTAHTAKWNDASGTLFSKLVFARSGGLGWIFIVPRSEDASLPQVCLVPITASNTPADDPIWGTLVSEVNRAFKLAESFLVGEPPDRLSVSSAVAMGKEGVFWAAFTAAPASPSLFVGCVFIEYRDGAARVEPFHSLKDCVVETLVPERVGTLKAFAVVPEYQRQGIGRHLFLYAQAEAEYAGCSSIELTVPPANSGMVAWYEAMGYTTIREDSMLMPHDVAVPTPILTKLMSKRVVRGH